MSGRTPKRPKREQPKPCQCSFLSQWLRQLQDVRSSSAAIRCLIWLVLRVTEWEESDLDGSVVGIVERYQPVPTKTIANQLHLSQQNALLQLRQLEKRNFVVRQGSVGHAYRYRVILAKPAHL